MIFLMLVSAIAKEHSAERAEQHLNRCLKGVIHFNGQSVTGALSQEAPLTIQLLCQVRQRGFL